MKSAIYPSAHSKAAGLIHSHIKKLWQ